MAGLTKTGGSTDPLQSMLAGSDGFKLVFGQKTVAGAVKASLDKRFGKQYDLVADFGADPTGQADSSAAVQAWLNAIVADGFGSGTAFGLFKLGSKVTAVGIHGMAIYCCAYFFADFNVDDYVFGFKNGSNGKIYGRFEVSGQNKIGIKSAVKIWSDTTGISYIDFYGLVTSYAATGVQFGDLLYPNALVSEISLIGGNSAGCPRAIYAIGTQCYINKNGFNAVSGGGGDLAPITQYTIHLKGAQLKAIGGEIQHNDNIFGAAVLIEPITDPVHGNSFGNFASDHTHIETAAALCIIANFDGVVNPISIRSGVAFVGSHGYHSQNNGGMIVVHDTAKADYEGTISTRNMTLYAGVIRTQPNIVAGPKTIVDYDPAGFGWQFVDGLQAVNGGILLFSHQPVLRVSNANGQSIGTSATVVNYTQHQVSNDTYRWQPNYSNGRFTVPYGGLKGVIVHANLRTAAGSCQLDVYVNSALKTLQSPAATTPSVTASLGDLPAGAIIDVRATMVSTASTANGGALETFTIYAHR